MTGLLIVLGFVALLILALEPAHRRRHDLSSWSGPGASIDRDRQRVRREASLR